MPPNWNHQKFKIKYRNSMNANSIQRSAVMSFKANTFPYLNAQCKRSTKQDNKSFVSRAGFLFPQFKCIDDEK